MTITSPVYKMFDLPSLIVWGLTVLMTVVVMIRMFLFKMTYRWRSFSAYLAFNLLWYILLSVSLIFLAPATSQFMYFWTFWVGQGVVLFFQFWILGKIVQDVSGLTGKWRSLVRGGFLLTSAFTLAVSCLLAFSVHSSFPSEFTRTVLYLDRSISFAWVLAFFAVIASADFIGLWWRRETFVLAAGFAFARIVESLCAYLATSPSQWSIASNVSNACYLLTLTYWAFKLRPPVPVTTAEHEKLVTCMREQYHSSFDEMTVPPRTD